MRIEASLLQGNHFASSSLLKPRRVHKSCGDMSQCTSIGSADASISRRVECKGTCNQGNFLESATRTQKTAYFSLLWRPKEAKPDSGLICGPKTETTNCKRSIEPARLVLGCCPAQVCELEFHQLQKSLATFHFPRFWSLL